MIKDTMGKGTLKIYMNLTRITLQEPYKYIDKENVQNGVWKREETWQK